MEEIIKLENIYKNYGKNDKSFSALKNISFCVKKGDYVSIVGNSGSGKSTLMNIIGFLDKQTSGNYYFCGKSTENLNEKQLSEIRANKIGFIFQGFNLISSLSALDNVILPLIYKKVPKKQRESIAISALDKVGLSNKYKNLPSELSGGQCQRVAIARAIATKPEIILADEPTGNLDSTSGKQIEKILNDLHHEGNTILLITHDKELAMRSPRIVKIKDGMLFE